uniref:Uncharacterized protein n=1 Tax=Cannabis sativa TaxID=3483 RepID=A0A803PK56_CANSA
MVREETLVAPRVETPAEAETVQEDFEDELNPSMGMKREIELMEDMEEVGICENPTKSIRVGRNLPPAVKEIIINTVKRNQDVLAWSHSDMTGIDITPFAMP